MMKPGAPTGPQTQPPAGGVTVNGNMLQGGPVQNAALKLPLGVNPPTSPLPPSVDPARQRLAEAIMTATSGGTPAGQGLSPPAKPGVAGTMVVDPAGLKNGGPKPPPMGPQWQPPNKILPKMVPPGPQVQPRPQMPRNIQRPIPRGPVARPPTR